MNNAFITVKEAGWIVAGSHATGSSWAGDRRYVWKAVKVEAGEKIRSHEQVYPELRLAKTEANKLTFRNIPF